MHYLPIASQLSATMTRGRAPEDQLSPKGHFDFTLVRDGEVVASGRHCNNVKNAAKNNILDAYFNGGSASANWYIGLVSNDTYSSDPTSDTMSSHAGWTEFAAYTVGSSDSTHRGTWGKGAAAGQAVTNASSVAFTFTGGGTVWGAFVCSNSTKGSWTGTLWSTASLNAPLAVLNGDVLNVSYTVQL